MSFWISGTSCCGVGAALKSKPPCGASIDNIAFENRADLLIHPLFAHRQGAAALNRPEPQGAPVVHDQLQAAVRGSRQVTIVVEQAFFAALPLLGNAAWPKRPSP